ncbi:MAG: NUDIX hydrolase [Candidatus Kerfeldbacteria bacterium]
MEYLDIIDKNNKVIGRASKEDIYAKKLKHRIVHALVFNNQNKMLLQQRGRNCNYLPMGWSTSVGGHVQSGESYKEAAIRETKEEIGITATPKLIYQDIYRDPRNFYKHLETFKIIHNGPFITHPHEVEVVKFFTMDEIKKMIKSNELFHPELLFLLNKYYQINKSKKPNLN